MPSGLLTIHSNLYCRVSFAFMSTRRLQPSRRVTKLASHTSPYHASVTLYEAESTEIDLPSTPRRSKRIKTEHTESEVMPSLSPALEVQPLDTSHLHALDGTQEDVKKPLKKTNAAMKSPKKQKAIRQTLDVPHPEPDNWRETYATIKKMRENIVAPVDTMGCDQAQFKETDPKNSRFATLVSLMLSSQTKDEVTDAAVSNLREALGGSLSLDGVINASEDTISQAICKVGFWRRKTGYIKQTAQRLRDDFKSDVPQTVDELCSLPGVGPKMAFLLLQVAWNLNVGIGVDVHVHRITNRLGWHRPPTKAPEETRLNLQSWLPSEYHREINHMLVGFGQMVCLPVGPRCGECDLSESGLCPSAQKGKKIKQRPQSRTLVKSSDSVDPDPGPKLEIELEQVVKSEA
ncbi:hypothetical protein HGRIS_002789 [Hohenbuehelia grisea]|uniref:Endonuclease III homolog n=1 Tax=Hohenbuehelia grisea TaxID=104357 RepID=A0ABR3JMW2_9AGAR